MEWGKQKRFGRDEVECRDFLFLARNDVFCDILQYSSTNNEIYLFYTIGKTFLIANLLGPVGM